MPNLMPHQREGVEWLVKQKRGLLWWTPGAGKTLTAIETLRRLGSKDVLFVAPVSLLSIWRDEAKKFYGLDVTIIRGSKEKRKAMWEGRGWCVVGYETLRSDFKECSHKWDAIVLDESGKVNNHAAKVTKCILKMEAPVRIALNGTAISNSYADLWPVCTWLEPQSLYGNFYRFRAIHAVMHPAFPAIVDWRATEEIERRVSPLISRKGKEEVLKNLPPLTEQVISFQLSPEERRVYKEIKEDLIVKIQEEEMPVTNALVELMRLRQVTNGLHAFGLKSESSKLRVMQDLLSTLRSDSKVIIFSQFKTTVNQVMSLLSNAVAISGDVDSAERDRAIMRWKHEPTCRYLVMTSAGEKGLNLQDADVMVHCDLPWSAASYEQRIGRFHRTGQLKPVISYTLEAEGTVDEKVRKILERKKGVSDKFLAISREDIDFLLN